MNILYVHNAWADNVGDRMSCPALYFPIHGSSIKILSLKSGSAERFSETHAIVFGGGGLLHPGQDESMRELATAAKSTNPGCKVVIWGVGSNYHNLTHAHWHSWLSEFDMVGLRDRANPFDYVPCASCMNRAFDITKPDQLEPFVVFEHHERPLELPYPTMQNKVFGTGATVDSLDEIVRFISGGTVVLTNSYHGAYWAQLLCRAVIVIEPFANRFHCGLPWPVVMATRDNYLARVGDALNLRPSHHLIDWCRRLNQSFSEKFVKLIKQEKKQ